MAFQKGKLRGKKENKPSSMAAFGKGGRGDALGPRHSAATFKKHGKKSRKHQPQASSEPSSSVSFLLAQDDEPDFPRGGASLLTKEEEAEARAEAEEEFEREMKWGRRNKEGKKRKMKDKGRAPGARVEVEDEWASLFGGGIIGRF